MRCRSLNLLKLFPAVFFFTTVLSFTSFQSALAQTTNLPGYSIRVWGTESGLPNDAVTAVVQTHDGYLWLATYDGLARFDGVTFTNFDSSTTPEMHSARVTSLFEDSKDNLWIGFETGELVRYRDGHFYATKFRALRGNRKKSKHCRGCVKRHVAPKRCGNAGQPRRQSHRQSQYAKFVWGDRHGIEPPGNDLGGLGRKCLCP